MAESHVPAEARYQLPEGTYRELIIKDRMTKFLKAEDARRHHADGTARVKAAAEQEVAAGRPIVVLAWHVQVTRYAHRLAAAPS